MKKNLNHFNTQDAVIIISSYPTNDKKALKSNHFNAMSWHSNKTVVQMTKNRPVIVIAEKIKAVKYQQINKNVLLIRHWKKSSPFSIISIKKVLTRLPKAKTVLIQFEFNLLGGIISNLALLILLFRLRQSGYRIVFELHQVLTDIGQLKKHIQVKNELFRQYYNFGLKIYYQAIGIISNEVIVLEQALKNTLSKHITSKKINTIPHPAENFPRLSKNKARKFLKLKRDDFIILSFGYINGYKGIDWLINKFSTLDNKNTQLIIAGGANPYLKNQSFYLKYFWKIANLAEKHKNITLTGYLPQSKIKYYFSACDLIVLPYEVFMSASGPFSHGLSFGKPIIMSNKLIDYSLNFDFEHVMKNNNLLLRDMFFNLENGSFNQLVTSLQNNKRQLKKLAQFSSQLYQYRTADKINSRLEKILFSPNYFPNYSFGLKLSGIKIGRKV